MPDYRPIFFVVGILLMVFSAAMLLAALLDAVVHDGEWHVFFGSAMLTAGAGAMITLVGRAREFRLQVREIFLITVASWLMLSLFGAVPMYLRGGLDYADALFESISGLTTTGSTVLVGLDHMPPGFLFWRSLLQWIGGVGIIVMAIMILPFLRVGGMQLFQSESSDRSEKVLARPFQLAMHIGSVYVILTSICALAYYLAGMTAFDAVNHAMTTLSTGGFSTHDTSMAYFKAPMVEWLSVVFMAAGSLPFVLYIKSLKGDWGSLARDQQVRGFAKVLVAATLLLAVWLFLRDDVPVQTALRMAAFNVTSIVTTTGFVSTDYSTWGAFAVGVFLLLTFFGGCTGSTSGAVKVFRGQILFLMVQEHMKRLLLPNGVFARRYNGRSVPDDVVRSVLAFIAAFIGATMLLTVALTAFDLDLVTAFSGAATAISNVGPGLGQIIGPVGNFAALPDGAKLLLGAGMLLGRLELFTVLVIFSPMFWRT
jgi:trk system potassium uptake protein TrkH